MHNHVMLRNLLALTLSCGFYRALHKAVLYSLITHSLLIILIVSLLFSQSFHSIHTLYLSDTLPPFFHFHFAINTGHSRVLAAPSVPTPRVPISLR